MFFSERIDSNKWFHDWWAFKVDTVVFCLFLKFSIVYFLPLYVARLLQKPAKNCPPRQGLFPSSPDRTHRSGHSQILREEAFDISLAPTALFGFWNYFSVFKKYNLEAASFCFEFKIIFNLQHKTLLRLHDLAYGPVMEKSKIFFWFNPCWQKVLLDDWHWMLKIYQGGFISWSPTHKGMMSRFLFACFQLGLYSRLFFFNCCWSRLSIAHHSAYSWISVSGTTRVSSCTHKLRWIHGKLLCVS